MKEEGLHNCERKTEPTHVYVPSDNSLLFTSESRNKDDLLPGFKVYNYRHLDISEAP